MSHAAVRYGFGLRYLRRAGLQKDMPA